MNASTKTEAQRHFEQALLHRAEGRHEEAIREFRETLRLYPASAVHGHLGVLLAELGRFDEAIEAFQTAIAAYPADAGAYFRLGMLLAGRNRHAEAAAAYEGFIKHCPPEMSGHLKFAGGRVAELKALAAPEQRSAPEPRLQAQKHFEQALLHRAEGRLEDAVAEFREALRLYPAAALHGQAGTILAELGRVDEAIAEFQASIAAYPADAGAYFRMGMLLAGRGRHAEAAAAYEGFIKHCPPEMSGHLKFAGARVADLKALAARAVLEAEPPAEPAARPEPEAAPEPRPEPVPQAQAAAPAPAARPGVPQTDPRAALNRALALGLIAVALAWAAKEYGPAAWERYQRERWPAVAAGNARLAAPMAHDNAIRRMADSVGNFRRVAEALTAAERKGQDVKGLRARLKEAETLMRDGKAAEADVVLNIIELRIPRKSEKVVPAEKTETDVRSLLRERPHRRAARRATKRRR